ARAVKEREEIERANASEEIEGAAGVRVIDQRHLVSLDYGLGFSCRPRRVQKAPRIVASPEATSRQRVMDRQRSLVCIGCVERCESKVAVRQDASGLSVLDPIKQEFRSAIVDQTLQFRSRHAPVERGEDGADFCAGEQDFEKLDAVAAENGDAVAVLDA